MQKVNPPPIIYPLKKKTRRGRNSKTIHPGAKRKKTNKGFEGQEKKTK